MNRYIFHVAAALTMMRIPCTGAAPVFVGVQPGVTVEPFYDTGEFDLNVVPLVVQVPVTDRAGFRGVTLVNLRSGGVDNGISDVGTNLALPVFLRARTDGNAMHAGWYAGPVLGLGRNLIGSHYTVTTAVEAGYLFRTENRFTLSLGIQNGATYFAYDDLPHIWRGHFGPKVNLLFRLGRRGADGS